MRTGPNIYKRKDGRWEARVLLARKPGGKSRYNGGKTREGMGKQRGQKPTTKAPCLLRLKSLP